MVLTPDSTGTTSSSLESAAAKKTRRQTAYYPNVNSSNKLQKPFSRSAAKRESVMMLGSIEHLQHYFTKTGIAAKKNPLSKQYHGLVPAIGGPTHIRISPSIGSQFELPPSPAIPPPQTVGFPPHVKAFDIDPESLLPCVVEDLAAVANAWSIASTSTVATQPQANPRASLSMSGSFSEHIFDVLGVLKITTRTVRSIRNYLLSLPDESAGTIRAHFRPKLLGPGKASSFSATASSSAAAVPDPLTLIRKSALEVLTVLRELEERYRLPLSDDAYDAHSDGGSRGAGDPHSRVASPSSDADLHPEQVELELPGHPLEADTSVTFSLVQVQGRLQTVPVWEDSEDEFASPNGEEERERKRREHWDERLVIGSGWLYRQDVTLAELEKERRVVGEYLDVVDEVLFEWKRDGEVRERGWERERRKALEKGDRGVSRAKARTVSAMDARERVRGPGLSMGISLNVAESGRRRVSTGMLTSAMGSLSLSEEPVSIEDINEDEEEEASVHDEELPVWAQRSSFIDNDLGRAHALLSTFLPSHLLSTLDPPSTSRTAFLTSLSSGQLLCVAYNACVRKSKHPWGYVSRDGIHDILALEKAALDAGADKDEKAPEGGKKGWTFRRSDNLRLWAGALKLRYMLPLAVPSHTFVQAQPQSPIGTPGITASTCGGGTAAPRLRTPVGSPVRASHRSTESPIIFDAKIVAKKEAGWEDMLEAVLLQWVGKAIEEKRSH